MKNNKLDYEFLILEFLKSFRLYHSDIETVQLMADIIDKKHISILTEDLKKIGKEKLSQELSKIVLEHIRSDNKDKYDLTSLLPNIISNHLIINDKETPKDKNNKKKLKASLIGALLLCSMVLALTTSKKESQTTKEDKHITKKTSINNLKINYSEILPNNHFVIKNSNLIKTNINTKTPEEVKKEKEQAKQDILYNFKKYKTVDEILKRQKELESLNLTKKDKIYKKCKLSAPLQWFIYEQSVMNNIPPDFTFSIIYTETRGGFNSSGTESYNGPGNYDLGLTQQNTKSALVTFCDKYKISKKKGYKLIRDNDYVNIISCFLIYKEISARHDEYEPIEFAGCYNGWLNWRQKEISRQYTDIFEDAYTKEYTKYHKIISKKKYKNR